MVLGAELVRKGVSAELVIGLHRGGIPVAYEVARALIAPLDVIVVKKLRAPYHDELIIGAVCADGTRLIQHAVVAELGVPEIHVDNETETMLEEAEAEEDWIRLSVPALDYQDKSVVIVDDGIATGASMAAAVRSAKANGASRVCVASPVASPAAVQSLAAVADDVVTVVCTESFGAVGSLYREFDLLADGAVETLLVKNRNLVEPLLTAMMPASW